MLYFHHDNRVFETGSFIVGNHYDIDDDILAEYNGGELFADMRDIVYMTEIPRDAWDYENVYRVTPSRAVKVHTNYSVVLCQEEVDKRCEYFRKYSYSLGYSSQDIRPTFIQWMREAYTGSKVASARLAAWYGYKVPFDEYEYITNSAKIDTRYLKYHNDYDSILIKAITDPIREYCGLQLMKIQYPSGSPLGDARNEGASEAYRDMNEWISDNMKLGE